MSDIQLSRIVGIFALSFAFVGLAFSVGAQNKPIDKPSAHTTLPAPAHPEGEITNVRSAPLNFSFNGEILVECSKGDFKIPPSDCRLMNGHSLDDFMVALIESEKMRDCTLKPMKRSKK